MPPTAGRVAATATPQHTSGRPAGPGPAGAAGPATGPAAGPDGAETSTETTGQTTGQTATGPTVRTEA